MMVLFSFWFDLQKFLVICLCCYFNLFPVHLIFQMGHVEHKTLILDSRCLFFALWPGILPIHVVYSYIWFSSDLLLLCNLFLVPMFHFCFTTSQSDVLFESSDFIRHPQRPYFIPWVVLVLFSLM